MTSLRILAVALLSVAVASPAHTQAPDSSRAAPNGIYTSAQAKRGAEAFRQSCAACHATTEFRGPNFASRWGSGTAFQYFDFLRTEMPIDNPGALEPDVYAAVIAYILELNGYPAGSAELPTDPAALRQIRLTPPSTPEP